MGGDPAINSFSSDDEWVKWAKSVETSAPTQTQYQLEDLASMVKDSAKAANLRKAIVAYAVAHNTTWPSADPVSYQLGWCDCSYNGRRRAPDHPDGPCAGDKGISCYTYECKEGYFLNAISVFDYGAQGISTDGGVDALYCCRPCFKN